ILAGLRRIGDAVFGDFESALGALEPINFGRFAAGVQPQVHRILTVFVQLCLDMRHVGAIGQEQNAAYGHDSRGRFVPAEHEVHAADQMDEKIAGQAGAVLFPATPTGKNFGVEGALGNGALPGVPIDSLGAGVGGRRIFPSAARIVAAERAFDQIQIANDASGEKFLGLGANHGADALRANLHDAAGFLIGLDHGDAVGGRVRHRLFAVDVLAGVDRIDDDLLVPVLRHSGDDAVDLFVVQEFLVFAGGFDFVADDFL